MAAKRKISGPEKATKAKPGRAVAKAKAVARAAPAKVAAKVKPAAAKVAAKVKPAAAKVAAKVKPAAAKVEKAVKKVVPKAAPAPKKAAAPKKAPAAAKAPAPVAAKSTKVRAVAKAVTEAALSMAKAVTDAVQKPAKAAKKAVKDAISSNGESKRLSVGDPAPSFSLPDQDGELVSSDSLAGKPYVLYFYPKDDTPGCTRQACGFRDDLGKFKARGIDVIGVSPDNAASHTRFIEKYGLNFTLLSDSEKALANAFGVWVKKQNYGRDYMGIERSTFLVNKDGDIEKVWRSVKVDGHIGAVYDATESIA